MNLREIDRLVAEKVMGWEPFYDDGDLISFVTEFGTLFFSDDDESEWNPTIDIADAWQVVEKLKNTGDVLIAKDFDDNQWEVEITIWQNESIHKHFVVKAETAPLAICLAALKSVGVEVDN
jgi:Phage ABA sandwich domain